MAAHHFHNSQSCTNERPLIPSFSINLAPWPLHNSTRGFMLNIRVVWIYPRGINTHIPKPTPFWIRIWAHLQGGRVAYPAGTRPISRKFWRFLAMYNRLYRVVWPHLPRKYYWVTPLEVGHVIAIWYGTSEVGCQGAPQDTRPRLVEKTPLRTPPF